MAVVYEDLLSDEVIREKVQEFLGLKADLKPAEHTRKQRGDLNTS